MMSASVTGEDPVRTAVSRFVLVAAGGFIVQMTVLSLLAGRAVALPLAVAIAVEAAILHNFFWHERWTFAGRRFGRDGRLQRWWQFNAAAAVTSVTGNILITGGLLAWMPMPPTAANAIAVVTIGALNFLLADRWAFRT
jgi:putative flippase GtrA